MAMTAPIPAQQKKYARHQMGLVIFLSAFPNRLKADFLPRMAMMPLVMIQMMMAILA